MFLNICISSKLLLVTFSILVISPMAISTPEEDNHFSERWGLTDVKISKTKYTWNINNFKFCCQNVGDSLKSPTFTSTDGCKWYLDISPKGAIADSKDYMSLFLYSANCNSSTTGRFSILNAKGEETNIKTISHAYERGKGWGFQKYILQTELVNEANELIVDNKLTITCEITAQVGTENSSLKLAEPKHYLVKDFGYLLDHQVFTDVTLISEEREFEAHKAILAVRSPVFKAKFDEKTGKRDATVVEITDVDCKTLAEMLRYIYTEQVFDLDKFAPTLLAAAENYKLGGLKTLSENKLRSNLNVANAIDYYILADKYGAHDLKNEAKRLIATHISEIAKTTGFKSLITSQPRLAVETFNSVA